MLETAEVVQLLKSVICVIFGCCEDEMSPAGYIGGECWELSIVCWLSSVSSSLTSLSHLSLPSRHSTVLSNSNPSLTASQLAENSLGLVRLLFSIDGLQWCPVVNVLVQNVTNSIHWRAVRCVAAGRGSGWYWTLFSPAMAALPPGQVRSSLLTLTRALDGTECRNYFGFHSIIFFVFLHRAQADSLYLHILWKYHCVKRVRKERFKDKWWSHILTDNMEIYYIFVINVTSWKKLLKLTE